MYLHRHVAMGWKFDDKWRTSIVFFTLFPHTKKADRRPGDGRITHIYCGPEKTKLLVNW